jgi:hypothetical protein
MKLPKPLQPFADRIAEVSDERDAGDGYWVYLKVGWRDEEGETHCVHEDTPTACARRMPGLIRCTVPGCCS